MRIRQILFTVAAISCLSAVARAQQASPNFSTASDTTNAAVNTSRASMIDRPSEAVRRPAPTAMAPIPSTGEHVGEAKAEMAVGAVAFVAGALIGNTAGTALMIGGAVVGLYGLWNYMK